MSVNNLTEDQVRRCEENRKRALAIRAKKMQEAAAGSAPSFYPTANKKNMQDAATGNSHSFYPTVNKPPVTASTFSTSSTLQSKVHAQNTIPKLSVQPQLKANSEKKLNSGTFNCSKQIVGSCVMVSRQRFKVEMDYHQPSIEVFKRIASRCYDAVTKRWSFDISDHDKLLSEMKKVQSAFIGGLPKFVYDVFKCAPKEKMKIDVDLSELDATLFDALMPFQKEGVSFGIQNNGRVMIADDMGLGKTIQAIGISAYYLSEWPLLVVTPSSVRYAWEEAFQKWLPSVHYSDINVLNSNKDSLQTGCVVILSYDMLSKKGKEITQRNFRVVIFDESHFLKNFKSARTKAAQQIVKHAKRVILLSGTPALSRPAELYTQINIVNPKLFPNYNTFGVRYCAGRQMPWGWDYSGSSNMGELQLILEETILIRRLKSEVITQLPPKQRQMIILDPSRIGQSKTLDHMSKEMSKKSLVGMERRGVLLQYFHTTGIVKIPAICDYLEELLEADKKFICFAHHQNVLDAVCDLLYQKKCDYIRIDGSTPSESRKTYCDKFQLIDSCKVAVLSITAANVGINLTAAQLVIFAELFWNPGILTQAEDRAHRIGQQDCVIVQYLVAKGTADDHIWPLIQKKLDTLSKAGLNKDNFTDADMMCASLSSTEGDSDRQTSIEDFFQKENGEVEDQHFWDSVFNDCDSIDEFEVKKMKFN